MDIIDNHADANRRSSGIIYAASSFAMWGILPVYWKLLKSIPANQILAHRIFWSFVFFTGLLVFGKQYKKIGEALKNRKNLMLIALCSIFITANWYTYIWAVNSGHIIETSMGYYINPLVSVFLGMAVLKEKLNSWQYTALLLAAAGVVMMAVRYGSVPWIALALALTFAVYGLLKKLVVTESLVGLVLETAILAPLALGFIAFEQNLGTGVLGDISPAVVVLLMGTGIITALPLLCFAEGCRRVDLTTVGFLQYLSPTLSLFLGIFIYKENFTWEHMLSFGFIWMALIIFTLSKTSLVRKECCKG